MLWETNAKKKKQKKKPNNQKNPPIPYLNIPDAIATLPFLYRLPFLPQPRKSYFQYFN